MKFYFVRHGKTQWNLEGRFQGANGDSPLLEESVHDLEKLVIISKMLNLMPFFQAI